ncbi:DUF2946 domain-containing protein [Ramlibacter sp. H39-3-26]|uniref:DUF2946 domain-containing protein n=1 Tax=Curvibacter soli TaxID=3031331 RepID=UPI0023DAEE83|nr:DUF2946 domain-containing protein [Ramlibacter sp. H39-3-26]MDF1485738.1 DUF2946 domain-containing protein [Ramlibacter sp. H39-3-26]
MQKLRCAHRLAHWVLAWWVLSVAVAMASPIIKPTAMELVCSGTGVMKVLIKTDDGTKEVSGPMPDCLLCVSHGGLPPVVFNPTVAPAQPLAYVLQSIPAAHIASLTAAPLPARGPPSFF